MKKIEIKGTDTYYYREKLTNGLDVILLPDENSKKKNYFINFGTYYGALTNSFEPVGKKKMVDFPHGIAHFLEHKCFEMKEEPAPFEFYASTGSYVNAFTNYDTTCYVVSGNKKFKENLEELLNFVLTPYFTDENILKEQGIITEEIHMREDDPDYQTFCTLADNLYHEYPLKYPVAGKDTDIKNITKELLYDCYNTFYRPENMFLVIGGVFNVDEVIPLVNSKFNKLGFTNNNSKVKKKVIHEKLEVVKEEETIIKDVKREKLCIGYKMKRDSFPIKDDMILDLYLNMLLSINFGNTSIFQEKVRNNNLAMMDGYCFDKAGDILTFIVETDVLDEDGYLALLNEKLNNLVVDVKDLERVKKVWISSEVMKTDYKEAMVNSIVTDLNLYHDFCDHYINLIRDMNIETMNKVIKCLNFKNKALVRMISKKDE